MTAVATDLSHRRVLIVSANMGGGHNAAGRALHQAVEQTWPGSRVQWVDTLDVMGRWVGPLFRQLYVTNVERTPLVYELFYSSLWRHRWFNRASKRFVGAWAGRRLAPVIERFDPDLILTTYPLGSAGLAWLRRFRGLAVPTGAWISDFAPHPFWVYPELDANLVVHDVAVPVARAAEPTAEVTTGTPPVVAAFHRGDQAAARAVTGLPEGRFVALLSTGSYGFGPVTEAARALLDTDPRILTVVVCGHNRAIRERLDSLGAPTDRLRTLGWVDDMASLTRAADLVVTNGGGVTVLEALATDRPLIMYRPIAAHGVANAALMSVAAVAEVCYEPRQLSAAVRTRIRAETGSGSGATDRNGTSSALSADLQGLSRRHAAAHRPWPVRGSDALFSHVQTPNVPQQVGVVVTVGPVPGRGSLTRTDLIELIETRIDAMPTLRRRLVSNGARLGWITDPALRAGMHVREELVRTPAQAQRAVDRFWSEPLPAGRPLWQLLLVRGLPGQQSLIVVKLHHALGDGWSVVGTLDRLLNPASLDRNGSGGKARVNGRAGNNGHIGSAGPEAPDKHAGSNDHATSGATGNAEVSGPKDEPQRHTRRERLHHAGLVVRGLVRLARAGPAPRHRLNQPLPTPDRLVRGCTIPVDQVKVAARRLALSPTQVCLGVVAEALVRVLPLDPAAPPLRAMMPVSLNVRERGRTWGNWTAATTVRIPLAPMSAASRIHAVATSLTTSLNAGEPAAASLALRAFARLPAAGYAALARRLYNSRRFNVIVSHIPGLAGRRSILSAPATEAWPVVGLAPDVPVGVGVLRWADGYGVGLLADATLAGSADAFPETVRAVLDELVTRSTAGGR